jgi:hypothetical protein
MDSNFERQKRLDREADIDFNSFKSKDPNSSAPLKSITIIA